MIAVPRRSDAYDHGKQPVKEFSRRCDPTSPQGLKNASNGVWLVAPRPPQGLNLRLVLFANGHFHPGPDDLTDRQARLLQATCCWRLEEGGVVMREHRRLLRFLPRMRSDAPEYIYTPACSRCTNSAANVHPAAADLKLSTPAFFDQGHGNRARKMPAAWHDLWRRRSLRGYI